MQDLLIVLLMIAYFIPSIVGYNCKKSEGIIILNLLLGWTLIGWVAALVWAVSGEVRPKKKKLDKNS